jgi:hypothetical protein
MMTCRVINYTESVQIIVYRKYDRKLVKYCIEIHEFILQNM